MNHRKYPSRFLLFAIPLLLVLTGCGKDTPPQLPSFDLPQIEIQEPTVPPAEQFTAELEEALTYQPQALVTPGSQAEAAIIRQVTCTVLSQTDSQVILSITAPDMQWLLDNILLPDGTTQDVIDALDSGRFETVTKEVTVFLDKNGKPVESWELIDALYGGMLTAFASLVQEMEAAG